MRHRGYSFPIAGRSFVQTSIKGVTTSACRAAEFSRLGDKIIRNSILVILSFMLTACFEVGPSQKEILLKKADNMESRGFTLNAADIRKEATSASDAEHITEIDFLNYDENPPKKKYREPSEIEGNEKDGYEAFPTNPVSVEEAIKRASPFLEKSTQRRAGMLNPEDRGDLKLYVYLIEGNYYIAKDTYPPKLLKRFGAVIVNSQTGKVKAPK